MVRLFRAWVQGTGGLGGLQRGPGAPESDLGAGRDAPRQRITWRGDDRLLRRPGRVRPPTEIAQRLGTGQRSGFPSTLGRE